MRTLPEKFPIKTVLLSVSLPFVVRANFFAEVAAANNHKNQLRDPVSSIRITML